MGLGFGFLCCGCVYFLDDFHRPDSTDLGPYWSEEAGDWEISAERTGTLSTRTDDNKITAKLASDEIVEGPLFSVPVDATSSICGVGTGAINGTPPVFDDFTLRYLQQDVQYWCPSCPETCIYLNDFFPWGDLLEPDWEIVSGEWVPYDPEASGIQTSSSGALILSNTYAPDPPNPNLEHRVSTNVIFDGTGDDSEARLVADYTGSGSYVYASAIQSGPNARYEFHIIGGGQDTLVYQSPVTINGTSRVGLEICFRDGFVRASGSMRLGDETTQTFVLVDMPYQPSTSRVGLWASAVPDYYGLGPIVFTDVGANRERTPSGTCGDPCPSGCLSCDTGTWRHTIQILLDNITEGEDCDNCESPWIVDLVAYSNDIATGECKWGGVKEVACNNGVSYQITCVISVIPSGYRITITVAGAATFVRDIIAESLDCTDLAGPVSRTSTGSDTYCDWSAATCEILDSFD